jgi:hypothetical protein
METACTYGDILVSPQEINFEIEQGAYLPPYQYVMLAKTGDGNNPNFVARAYAEWLTVHVMNGEYTVPGSVRLGLTTVAKNYLVGKYNVYLTIQNTSGTAVLPSPIVTVTLKVKPKPGPPGPPPLPLNIVTVDMPAGVQNEPYVCQFNAEGGTPPYYWSYSESSYIPYGLSLDAVTGELKGIPISFGSYGITIIVKDSTSNESKRDYTLQLSQAPEPPPPPPTPPNSIWETIKRIIGWILEHIFKIPSASTVHSALEVLEDMGYITSTQQHGKRVYTITDEGLAALKEHEQKIKEHSRRVECQ